MRLFFNTKRDGWRIFGVWITRKYLVGILIALPDYTDDLVPICREHWKKSKATRRF